MQERVADTPAFTAQVTFQDFKNLQKDKSKRDQIFTHTMDMIKSNMVKIEGEAVKEVAPGCKHVLHGYYNEQKTMFAAVRCKYDDQRTPESVNLIWFEKNLDKDAVNKLHTYRGPEGNTKQTALFEHEDITSPRAWAIKEKLIEPEVS